MAKTQKYRDELLLEAVVKYAELNRGKIVATKLAEWASANIDGLEGVRDYHFTRPYLEKEPTTGKNVSKAKRCTEKINKINAARNTIVAINGNTLLRSANVDAFFLLPKHVQRELILQTREQVDRLTATTQYLQRENRTIAEENKALRSTQEELSSVQTDIINQQKKLMLLLRNAISDIDECKRKEILEKIGIHNGTIDLLEYTKSLTYEAGTLMGFNEAIKQHQRENSEVEIDSLMKGLDFDENENDG